MKKILLTFSILIVFGIFNKIFCDPIPARDTVAICIVIEEVPVCDVSAIEMSAIEMSAIEMSAIEVSVSKEQAVPVARKPSCNCKMKKPNEE